MQIGEVIEMAREERPDFRVFSGDDGLTFGVMALGGCGIISVASNLVPKEVKDIGRVSEFEWIKDGMYQYKDYKPIPCGEGNGEECSEENITEPVKTSSF